MSAARNNVLALTLKCVIQHFDYRTMFPSFEMVLHQRFVVHGQVPSVRKKNYLLNNEFGDLLTSLISIIEQEVG